MERHIRIIHGFEGSKSGSLCFMTLSGQNDVTRFTFEDRPQGTALQLLYERICLGDSFPPEMIINGIHTPNHAFAASLFADPTLVLKTECLPLISSFNLFHRWSDVSHAHIPHVHLRIIQEVTGILNPDDDSSNPTLEDAHRRLGHASTVIESYLSFGTLPFDMKDSEDESLIFLEDDGPLAMFRSDVPKWGEFYKHGFLCGIWLSPATEGGFEKPVFFRKSSFVEFDLQELGRSLNAQEFSSTQNKQGVGWLCCNDPNILLCPTLNPYTGEKLSGTSLSIEMLWKTAKTMLRKK